MTLIERAAERLESPRAPPRLRPAPVPRAAPLGTQGPVAAASPAGRPSPSGQGADRSRRIALDLRSLGERGFVVPEHAAAPIAQEFRVIKRPLLSNAFGKGTKAVPNGRRVMVTSALAGEGKSFCAINLAMSIAAERDHHVLLVDTDVARPSIPGELGIEPGPGLMDWLLDRTPDLDRLVRPSSIDKLSLLLSGRQHPNATELLASDEMGRLVEELSTRYPDRIVIFDSPPLLLTTEARVLASYMGQIVMVVEAGRTPRDAVGDALATIAPTSVVGLVLNKAREPATGGYYGFQGYGYGIE